MDTSSRPPHLTFGPLRIEIAVPGNQALTSQKGRVEHWCQGYSAGLSVPTPFGWRCLPSPGMPRTPAPPHRTVHAVCPHTALRSPSAAGMHGAIPAWRSGLAPTGTAPSTARGDSPKAIPARASRQGRSESAAPSLGSGYVVPTLQAVSGRRRRTRRCWPPSAAQTVHAVFPHTAFTKAPHGDARKG